MRVAVRTLTLCTLLATCVAPGAFAAPVLTGATLSFSDAIGPVGPESAPFVAGPEYCGTLVAVSCTANAFTAGGILLSNDFIDFTGTSITFDLEGGGADIGGGYRDLGLDDPTATFTISGLTFSESGFLSGVSVSLTDVAGVAVGSEVTFTANSISFIIGTLGVLDDDDDRGRIVLNLAIRNDTPPPPPVPEPTSLVLLGAAGVMGLARARRRAGK